MANQLSWIENDYYFLIKLPEQFNFKRNLNYLKKQHDNCLYDISNNKITRLINIKNHKVLLQISEYDKDHLVVHCLLSTIDNVNKIKLEVIQFIEDWFDLNRDLIPFYKMAEKDPILKQVVKDNYGLRNIGIPDLFESLCWAILGQQINLTFAATLKRQFVETFGDFITYKEKQYWSFPSHEKIASLEKEDMSHIKMTERKKDYIIGIAQAMENEELSKEKLLQLNDSNKIENELTKLHGVGPWTAQYVLMRCLRYPSTFPIDDVGLINAIQRVKKLKEKPTKREILNLFDRWKNWESYATFYLWESLY